MSEGSRRRRFTKQFKLDAVRLSDREDMTISQAAADLGVPLKRLYRWRHEFRAFADDAFRGNGNRTTEQPDRTPLERANA